MKPNSRDHKYLERCLRARGIMTEAQQLAMRETPVAIGGMGLGGAIFLNLVRLGFERFHVADPDVYERTNINRQRGARETTIGCRKDDCLIQEARAINPDVEIKTFPEGVNAGNVWAFLDGIAWVVDAVDIFAMPEKIALHHVARERGLPVISCVSVGFGASIVAFDRTTPSFAELSGLRADAPYVENVDRFVKFVTPEIPAYMAAQLGKAMDRSSHIPFVVPGVEISAAMVTTEMCKHLLGIGERVLAPHGIYFDPVNVQAERFVADYRARGSKKSALKIAA